MSVQLVKELRQRTGAPMMDCQRALKESNGDIEAAIEIMRKSGQVKAAKKAGRTAAEGVVKVKSGNGRVVVLEVNSETDFVARDESFNQFVDAVIDAALENKLSDIDSLNNAKLSAFEGATVEEARQNLVAKIGENITVRRVSLFESSNTLSSYQHGTKIGVAVELEGGDDTLAKDICMHIAASNPEVISQDSVSEDRLTQERKIVTEQAQESGKPKEIVEKMVEGRLKKFVNEISLLGQPFVKDPDTSVGDLIKGKAKVLRFVRFEVGEGIEKEEVDFAKEVMEQAKGS